MRRLLPLLALLALPLLAQAEAKPALANGSKAFVVGVTRTGTVGGAYFLSSTGSLRMDVGFNLAFKPATASFSVDAGYRHHFSTGALRPFFQPGLSFGYANLVNVAIGAGLGVEYFVTPRLSVAGMATAALTFSNGGSNVDLGLGSSGLFVSFFL